MATLLWLTVGIGIGWWIVSLTGSLVLGGIVGFIILTVTNEW